MKSIQIYFILGFGVYDNENTDLEGSFGLVFNGIIVDEDESICVIFDDESSNGGELLYKLILELRNYHF